MTGGERAPAAGETGAAGMPVVVHGNLTPRTYTQDGQRRTVIELIVQAAGPDLRY